MRGTLVPVNESAPQSPSVFGALARKTLAWIVLLAVAVILVKVAIGIVVGLVSTVLLIVLLGALGFGVLWALRRL
jgi:hypothetical protein